MNNITIYKNGELTALRASGILCKPSMWKAEFRAAGGNIH